MKYNILICYVYLLALHGLVDAAQLDLSAYYFASTGAVASVGQMFGGVDKLWDGCLDGFPPCGAGLSNGTQFTIDFRFPARMSLSACSLKTFLDPSWMQTLKIQLEYLSLLLDTDNTMSYAYTWHYDVGLSSSAPHARQWSNCTETMPPPAYGLRLVVKSCGAIFSGDCGSSGAACPLSCCSNDGCLPSPLLAEFVLFGTPAPSSAPTESPTSMPTSVPVFLNAPTRRPTLAPTQSGAMSAAVSTTPSTIISTEASTHTSISVDSSVSSTPFIVENESMSPLLVIAVSVSILVAIILLIIAIYVCRSSRAPTGRPDTRRASAKFSGHSSSRSQRSARSKRSRAATHTSRPHSAQHSTLASRDYGQLRLVGSPSPPSHYRDLKMTHIPSAELDSAYTNAPSPRSAYVYAPQEGVYALPPAMTECQPAYIEMTVIPGSSSNQQYESQYVIGDVQMFNCNKLSN